MAYETETKVLDINTEQMKGKLRSVDAREIQDTTLIVDWYHVRGTKPGEDPWFLRIRSNSEGGHEVTWKAKSDVLGVSRRHKEINFMVEEPEKLAELFDELGLEPYAHQEKRRTSFEYEGWRFDIDQYPGMPAYMEIEGASEEHVKEALAMLGLESNRTSAEGERVLIQDTYGLDWYDMRFQD